MAQSTDEKPTPKSDERNLVAAIASEADLEDQLASIWEENKRFIILSILGIFVAFGAYHFVKFLSSQAEVSQQESYAAADDDTSRLAFAKEESSAPLGGFAYKELGDSAYTEGDYAKAADYYTLAAAAAKSAIKDAALMGKAMALLKNGQTDQAKQTLQTILSNEEAGNLPEARYRLAALAFEEGDYDYARTLITELQANISQESFYWLQKAMAIQSKLPKETAVEE